MQKNMPFPGMAANGVLSNNMSKIKNSNYLIIIGLLILTSCANQKSQVKQTLFVDNFMTNKNFIMFADTPPNPLIPSDLNDYKDLGMNVMLLTEDYTPMVDSNGQLTEAYKNSIKAIGSAGLECWIRNMYNDADYFDNSYPDKSRSNYGTPYTLSERHLTDEFKQFEAVTGFYMADEPYQLTSLPFDYNEISSDADYTYAAMDQYDKLVDWFNQYYGQGYSWHMNHVPSSSYNHWPSNGTYQSFLQYYADNILNSINSATAKDLSIDNYPFQKGTYNISATYLSDLLTGALVTKQFNANKTSNQKANFGLCIQAFSDENGSDTLRAPTSVEEITYQIYTGMSLGAKTYEFFLYRSIQGLNGMVNANGEKTDQYHFVKSAIERTKDLSKVICDFDWQNLIVCKANQEEESDNYETFDAINRMIDKTNRGKLKDIKSHFDSAVGYFNNGEYDGYLITNQLSPYENQSNTVKLTFNDANQALVFHNGTYQWQKLLDGQLQINVGPGDGYFVIVG